jgi:hypothetical protein
MIKRLKREMASDERNTEANSESVAAVEGW